MVSVDYCLTLLGWSIWGSYHFNTLNKIVINIEIIPSIEYFLGIYVWSGLMKGGISYRLAISLVIAF